MWLAAAAPALAATKFLGVAAGDMTSDSVVLWTRAAADDGAGARVTARIATDPALREVVWSAQADTRPADDNTLKLLATGLRPGTRYWYDFRDEAGIGAGVGQFRTAEIDRPRLPSAHEVHPDLLTATQVEGRSEDLLGFTDGFSGKRHDHVTDPQSGGFRGASRFDGDNPCAGISLGHRCLLDDRTNPTGIDPSVA